MMCGGFTQDQPMTDEVKTMTMKFKANAEAKMNATYATFEPESYQSQVVAGTNYNVKVKTDKGYIKIKIFKPLPCNGTEPQFKNVESA